MIIKVKEHPFIGIPLYRCTLCLSQNRGKKSMISHTIGCKYLEPKKKKTKKLRKY